MFNNKEIEALRKEVEELKKIVLELLKEKEDKEPKYFR